MNSPKLAETLSTLENFHKLSEALRNSEKLSKRLTNCLSEALRKSQKLSEHLTDDKLKSINSRKVLSRIPPPVRLLG